MFLIIPNNSSTRYLIKSLIIIVNAKKYILHSCYTKTNYVIVIIHDFMILEIWSFYRRKVIFENRLNKTSEL